ncbi:MAG TPA: hypothetical protein VGH28_21165 [Polyangiaceae bacterium]|jgi:hypothetical protein
MRLLRIFALAAVAACGGAETTPTNPTTPPTATVATATASVPAPSATATAPSARTPDAAPHKPTSLVEFAGEDSHAAIAKRYGGATVPLAKRVALMNDFSARWAQLASAPVASRERDAAAWLKARPEIEDAGVLPGRSVWARFKDGKLVIVPTDWPTPSRGGHHARVSRPHDLGAKQAPQPDAKALALVDSVHYEAQISASMRHWSADSGYVATGADGTVDALRSGVKNVGVFYMNAHGGGGFERDLDPAASTHARPAIYALMTSTPVLDANGARQTGASTSGAMKADANASKYEGELSRGELVYFYGVVADPTGETWRPEWRYAITHRFVAKNFSFSKDAFVFLNACGSFSPDAADMTTAFWNLKPALLLGWSFEVAPDGAMRAAEFLFDRLLGANKMSDHGLSPDKPKQRPWSFVDAFADMQSKGYDTVASDASAAPDVAGKTATLQYWNDGDVALVPIIDYMESDDVKHELTLHGTFGDDPADKDRHVKIAGADCPVKTWSAEKVTCDLGADFKHGDVVADKHGRKSNASPLTGWNVHLQYKLDTTTQGHFGWGIGFEAHVRADVHKYRESPSAAPKARDPVPFYVAPDSQCGSTGDKGYFAANGGRAWMASGKSIPLLQGPPHGDFCLIYGQIDPQAKQLKIAIMAITAHGAGTFNVAGPGVNRSYGIAGGIVPAPGLFDGSLPPPPGLPPGATMPTAMYLSFDDKGNIASGKKGPVDLGGSGKIKVSVEWDAASADDYPTDDTPQ